MGGLGEKRVSDPLELWLQVFMVQNVGAGRAVSPLRSVVLNLPHAVTLEYKSWCCEAQPSGDFTAAS